MEFKIKSEINHTGTSPDTDSSFDKYQEQFKLPPKTPGGWHYHPFELSISGFSGSGKTTLIEKLIPRFLELDLSVGYIKHDAHKFFMDKEGKDTYRNYQAGASSVSIRDPKHHAMISRGDYDTVGLEQSLLPHDICLIEGNKYSDLPKLFLLDNRGEGLEILKKGDAPNVLAVIGPSELLPSVPGNYIQIDRNDITSILKCIMNYYMTQTPQVRGLLLIGGHSRRMKQNKTDLSYQGKSQVYRALDLLKEVCGKVSLSLRPDQTLTPPLENQLRNQDHTLLKDRYLGFGPLGGILSAMDHDPRLAWLVMAVDMPFTTQQDLVQLISQRFAFRFATAIQGNHQLHDDHNENGKPEPLCCLYEPKSRNRILGLMARGVKGPRRFLQESRIGLVETANPYVAFNVNTPEEYRLAQDYL